MPFNKNRLLDLCKQRNLTCNKVAWETMIDKAVLHRIAKGEVKNPEFGTVQILADYFKVNIESFRKGIEI